MKRSSGSSLVVSVLVFAAAVLGGVFVSAAPAYAATQVVTSSIATTTTWVSTNVYVVSSSADVNINSGVKLTINPGTVVKFNTNARLINKGTLDAQGTATSTIY